MKSLFNRRNDHSTQVGLPKFSKYLLAGLAALTLIAACKSEPKFKELKESEGRTQSHYCNFEDRSHNLNEEKGRYLYLGRYEDEGYFISFYPRTPYSADVRVWKAEYDEHGKTRSSEDLFDKTVHTGESFTVEDFPTETRKMLRTLDATIKSYSFMVCGISGEEVKVASDVKLEQRHSEFYR